MTSQPRRALLTRIGAAVTAAGLTAMRQARAQERSITLASTTSTEQSGLFGHILPLFSRGTGIAVRVVALGTGQALDVARRGDADAVLVHDREAEEQFVAEGFADPPGRRPVMYNDFVIAGPRRDPAGVAGLRDATEALRRIAESGTLFVSRGDRSGTHAAERRLWREAGITPTARPWYREVGQGMGPTLNIAAALDACTLTDRGTWLAFRNRRDLVVLVEGDRRLFNQYGVMVVSPARHPHVKAAEARRFAEWLVSTAGQDAIAAYRIGGEQLFFPNAHDPTA
jgi:tungstate transport system substrate-binding protein